MVFLLLVRASGGSWFPSFIFYTSLRSIQAIESILARRFPNDDGAAAAGQAAAPAAAAAAPAAAAAAMPNTTV